MADATSAVRWLRSHSAELGLDPSRLVAAGGSSGGHLALSTAVFSQYSETGENESIPATPNALVLFNPAVDTTHGPARLVERFGSRAAEASPLHHLHPGLPPTLILHGKADAVVPYSDAEVFCERAAELGNSCTLIGYDRAPHGFFNQDHPQNVDGRWYWDTLLEMDRFLTTLGYLTGPAPTRLP
jgi:acetyl esterase/lipase